MAGCQRHLEALPLIEPGFSWDSGLQAPIPFSCLWLVARLASSPIASQPQGCQKAVGSTAGLDQLQHLEPHPTGTTLTIEGLENQAG